MLEDVVDGITPVRQPVGRPRKRPAKLHGDKGYDYPACRPALARRGIRARIARKGIESSKRLGRHRYVIERCLEWVTRFRRLVRRYDRKASHFHGRVRLSSGDVAWEGSAGDLIIVPDARHALEALEDCAALLTVAKHN
jgi:hypothetical protein